MSDVIEQIREELSGGDKWAQEGEASSVFALAVNSFTRWPVDAWAGARDEQGRLRKLYWIKGNALGVLTAEGDENRLRVVGSLHLISKIKSVQLAADVTKDDYHLRHGQRAITIEIGGVDGISLDVSGMVGHLRVRANEFIDALLDAVNQSGQTKL